MRVISQLVRASQLGSLRSISCAGFMNRLSRESWAGRAARAASAVCCALVLPSAALAHIPCAYEVTEVIEAPPCQFGNSVHATAISPSGKYACGYVATCGAGDTKRAWLYDTATDELLLLPLPAGIVTSMARDVSEEYVVGEYAGLTGDFGFIYEISTGEYTSIPPQEEGGTCVALGVNDSGTVCGYRSIKDDDGDPVSPWNAFVWSEVDGFIDLGVMTGVRSEARDISDAGYVCGWTGSTTTSNAKAFLWHKGDLQILPPVPDGITSVGHGVDNAGTVVGSGRMLVNGTYLFVPFVWHDNAFTILQTLPDYESGGIAAVNSSGLMIGACGDGPVPNLTTPCIWSGDAVFDLSALITGSPSIETPQVIAIADNGQILARGLSLDGYIGLVLSPFESLMGDANCDQAVDVDDLLAVITNWGMCAGCSVDFNGDESVNLQDLEIVLTNWTF